MCLIRTCAKRTSSPTGPALHNRAHLMHHASCPVTEPRSWTPLRTGGRDTVYKRPLGGSTPKRQLRLHRRMLYIDDSSYIKSWSVSHRTQAILPFGLFSSSFRKEFCERAAFSALRASESSRPPFFLQIPVWRYVGVPSCKGG